MSKFEKSAVAIITTILIAMLLFFALLMVSVHFPRLTDKDGWQHQPNPLDVHDTEYFHGSQGNFRLNSR